MVYLSVILQKILFNNLLIFNLAIILIFYFMKY